jgi:hypothetical protein
MFFHFIPKNQVKTILKAHKIGLSVKKQTEITNLFDIYLSFIISDANKKR